MTSALTRTRSLLVAFAADLGTIHSGEAVFGNGTDPTATDFTGIHIKRDDTDGDGTPDAGFIKGINAGTVQAYFDTDGKIKAGGDATVIDEDGVTLNRTESFSQGAAVTWANGLEIWTETDSNLSFSRGRIALTQENSSDSIVIFVDRGTGNTNSRIDVGNGIEFFAGSYDFQQGDVSIKKVLSTPGMPDGATNASTNQLYTDSNGFVKMKGRE